MNYNSKFHNNGPTGERDYEDAGNQNLHCSTPDPIKMAIARREAQAKANAKRRDQLQTQKVREFELANGRKPLRTEMDRINRAINAELGL